MDKISIFIQRFIRLRYMVIIFFISRHIDNFICNTRILWICLINFTVRSFHKSVFIDTCIGCKRVDQTDVWTFRCFDRTHSSIVRIVNVSNLETCTVSGKTTWTKC